MLRRLSHAMIFGLSSVMVLGGAAQANILVTFDEGAPKDRFTIENTGACAVSSGEILLDLAPSNGQLIFDVTE